ncbi:MAG: prepilin-type N-terminal cleavage/methylation domain-containing protein [Candidatus Omnitrophota bacterium]
MRNGRIGIKNRRRTGFTLVEIMIVVSIIALLASLSIPIILRARHNADEGAAQTSLKTICGACVSYFGANEAYPDSLEQLAGEVPPYIDPVLASGSSSGYDFAYEPGDDGVSFTCTATPQVPGRTGTRIFVIDQSGLITESEEE